MFKRSVSSLALSGYSLKKFAHGTFLCKLFSIVLQYNTAQFILINWLSAHHCKADFLSHTLQNSGVMELGVMVANL